MTTPYTQAKRLLPRRTPHPPRKLNYKNCQYCRHHKVKCEWKRGSWPNKCQRCSDKDFPCSEPCRKAEERDSAPQLFHDPGSSCQMTNSRPKLKAWERFSHVLELLPLNGITLMVLQETTSLTREFTSPLMSEGEDSYRNYQTAIDIFVDEFQQLAHRVQQSINELISHGKLAMGAAVDVARFSYLTRLPLTATIEEKWENFIKVREMKNEYSKQGRYGMVYFLTIYLSTIGHEKNSINMDVTSIEPFLDDCIANFKELKNCVSTLRKLEWFTPTRSIANLPSARSRIRKPGFKDFLGRSIPLLEYDAGIPVRGVDILHDRPDKLGRTLLHVSCVKNDERMLDILLEKGLICTAKTISGLSPLHIVAITGSLEIFKKLHAYYISNGLLEAELMKPDASGRNILQLAARYGKSEIIDFVLSYHRLTLNQPERLRLLWPGHADFMYQSGKIGYEAKTIMSAYEEALRYDWTEVVRVLSVHFDSPMWDTNHRTPLWHASHYGRFQTIKTLFRQDYKNKPDIWGYTPLMAAATAGHEKVLNQLCSFGGYLVGNTKTATRLDNLLDLRCVDGNNKTARDLATDNGHHECARFLGDMMEIVPVTIQL